MSRPPLEAVIEDATFLADTGEGLTQVARRIGMSPGALERRLYHHGRADLFARLAANEAPASDTNLLNPSSRRARRRTIAA